MLIYLWDFTYEDLEDMWNKINKYLSLSERHQTLKYLVSRFTAPFRIWIYDMLPAVRACVFVLRKNRDTPRMKRWSGTKKLKWVDVNKIFSNTQYVYGERKSIPSPVQDHFRRQDEINSIPVPPPAFVVVHDFSVLRLKPYVAGGEVVIQNYLFHSYDVQHRLFNLVLDRDFWSALFGHTHDGWLEGVYHNFVQHITIWYRLLMERHFDSDRHTIMPPSFFVCHVLVEGYDWRVFMASIATYPNFMVTWWDVDTVLMPIHSSPNHRLFGELQLTSMEVHIIMRV
uniref:Uncharacterized protein n=1 Tax=Lactuca sativa TaxID=4236 RepID=A0A9R1XCQ8_LACSA|nr:hypothetical protein LSAT_V11C400193300 [Lactuca sativa]